MPSLAVIDNIGSTINPLHICCRVIGLASFSITGNKGTQKGFIKFQDIFSILMSTIFICFTITQHFFKVREAWAIVYEYYSELFYAICLVTVIVYNMILLVVIWMTFAMRHKFVKILNIFHQVDEILLELQLEVTYKRHRVKLKMILIFVVLFTITLGIFVIVLIYLLESFKQNIIFLLSNMYLTQSFLLTNLFFTYCMWTVKMKYESINVLLLSKFSSMNDEISFNIKCQSLRQLSKLYDMLADVSASISQYFGVPIMLHMLPNSAFIIIAIFGTFFNSFFERKSSFIINFIHTFYMCIIIAVIFGLLIVSHITKCEVWKN
jgi:7tm Chemosensory receptor